VNNLIPRITVVMVMDTSPIQSARSTQVRRGAEWRASPSAPRLSFPLQTLIPARKDRLRPPVCFLHCLLFLQEQIKDHHHYPSSPPLIQGQGMQGEQGTLERAGAPSLRLNPVCHKSLRLVHLLPAAPPTAPHHPRSGLDQASIPKA
jgi:hypothetical protein